MTRQRSSSLSVLLLPSDRATELLDLVEDWTRAWLISPALWITAQDVLPDGDGKLSRVESRPPLVRATIIGRNGRRSVDMFEELGRYELDLLRLVAVRTVGDELAFEEDQDVALDVLRSYLGRSQPDTTKFVRINLIFAPSQVQGGNGQYLLESGWHANVVVAAEDRPTPGSFDSFTRGSELSRFDGFVLAHSATAAGLWPNIPESPYDGSEATHDGTSVQLQRVGVRGVLSDGLVLNVATEALLACSDPKSPLADPLVSVDVQDLEPFESNEVDGIVDQLVKITLNLDGGRLAYQRVDVDKAPTKRRLGFFASIGEFLAFSWDKTRNLPWFLADSVRGASSKRLTTTLHGAEGEAVVELPRLRSSLDSMFQSEVRAIEGERAKIAADFVEPLPPTKVDTFPRLWEGLRRLTFAILDGSGGPGDVEMPRSHVDANRSRVLVDANHVYPDWREQWTIPAEVVALQSRSDRETTEISWLDLTRANALLAELESQRERRRKRELELIFRLRAVTSERENLEDSVRETEFRVSEAREDFAWLQDDFELERPGAEGKGDVDV